MSAAEVWAATTEPGDVDHFVSRTGGRVHAGVLGGVRENGEIWLRVPCGLWANADQVDYTSDPLTCLICARITGQPVEEGTVKP